MANGYLHGEDFEAARARYAKQAETGKALAAARFERGDYLTDDEKAALTHNSRYGSDGYPVVRRGRYWYLNHPTVATGFGKFETKSAATIAWEVTIDTLIALNGLEAKLHALATELAAAVPEHEEWFDNNKTAGA